MEIFYDQDLDAQFLAIKSRFLTELPARMAIIGKYIDSGTSESENNLERQEELFQIIPPDVRDRIHARIR